MNPPGKITVVSASRENLLCPTLIVGITDDGSTVYARYRFGRLSIRIDDRDPAPNGGAEGRRVYEEKLDPQGLDGCLDYAELRELTAGWIDWPDELIPRKIDADDVMEI
jgi:hypothetical protein